ncbi:putative Mg2+ transporter-C (MgtC) family protein [Gemmobacter aquatilis]|uniref:Protein MgtC n=1 Tax=Gemmobacter aquatilis TaxID=933059 RepID=A0A1H8GAS6_9RHOB|nr:MgtC/SapB family protein [Gemmobacter aquatilis]SEN41136.1 putative Mg2+ transporter-C (MgtC) family protein [Gemmobacter aquatilis]
MIPSLDLAAINMAVALGCGALIGSERQVRQRMAGLRTNALVALGAASFVLFSTLFPNEVSPTRVAAQVVSGIGFLGAGIIFRDGFNVHGLNTAATLWCSAAVGLMAGAGFWPHALMLTGFVVFINLGLRPLVKWLKRKTNAGVPILRHYQICITGTAAQEAEIRALLLRTLAVGGLHLVQIELGTAEGDGITVTATINAEGLVDSLLDQAAARLAAEPGLRRVSWQVLDEN